MNVALFTDTFIPTKNGVATHVYEIMKGLRRKGHSVSVVTSAFPVYEERDGDVLRLHSVRVPFGHGMEIYYSLGSQRTVEDFLRPRGIDIVHTHSEFAIGRSGKKAARNFGVPLIHTFHTMYEDYSHYFLGGRIISRGTIRRVLRRLLKGVESAITPSDKSADYLHGLMPGLRTTVIPNGVDVQRITSLLPTAEARRGIREELGLREDDFVLIFVGRINIEKRVFELLQVAEAAARREKRVRFVVVGSGPVLPALRRRAAEGPIPDAFRFTDAVPWESVIAYCAIADVFLTVSLSEVQPMTIIEALACGLPVIARRDICFADMVREGINGHLVDEDEMAVDRILALAQDRALCERYSRASRDIASRFSVMNTVEMLERLYAEKVAAAPKRASAAAAPGRVSTGASPR
jgi:1,2-diacylglycerol 3-alpha-glucosyltransferase